MTTPPSHRASPATPKSKKSPTPRKSSAAKSPPPKLKTPEKEAGGMSEEAAALLAEATSPSFRAMHESPNGSPSNDHEGAEEEDAQLQEAAEAAWESGELDEAEALYRKLLGGRRTALGDRHAATIEVMDSLGAFLFQAKDDAKGALELLHEALKARKDTLGSSHVDTVKSLTNTGMMCKQTGALEEAEILLREALRAMAAFRDGGDHDPSLYTELLLCKSHLGAVLREYGEQEQAAVAADAVGAAAAVDGEKVDASVVPAHLAKLAEAAALLREAVSEMQEGDPPPVEPHDPALLSALSQLGQALLACDEVEESEAPLRQALAGSRELCGDQHPQTLANMGHLARLSARKGDRDGSLMLRQQVLAGYSAIGHPSAAVSANEVIGLLVEMGREDEAKELAAMYVDGQQPPPPDEVEGELPSAS